MLRAENLVKRFEDKTALDGLNTEIRRGCIYGLVGPNGSGKSTLMRLMCGVYRPDGGRVTLEGEDIFENIAAKDRILYLSDDLYFPPKSTVEDLASFYRGLYSGFSMETYHTLCGCFPLQTDQPLSTFSKGMRRQAALLAALCCHADYLLLDEAFDGLDPGDTADGEKAAGRGDSGAGRHRDDKQSQPAGAGGPVRPGGTAFRRAAAV